MKELFLFLAFICAIDGIHNMLSMITDLRQGQLQKLLTLLWTAALMSISVILFKAYFI